jgi:hypothetical protein
MGGMTGRNQGDTPQSLEEMPQGSLQVANETNQSFGSSMEAQAQRIADAQKRAQEFRTQLMGQFIPGQGQYRRGQQTPWARQGWVGTQQQQQPQDQFMGLLAQMQQQQQQQLVPQNFFGTTGNNGA